ncbi:MAG TPA: DUF4249 family protein, partial [Saprospiraceae bacterium]|nr:DUF4249 family protein [Saprospiraceae bacterium]
SYRASSIATKFVRYWQEELTNVSRRRHTFAGQLTIKRLAMKKLFLWLPFAALLIQACSNDFDLVTDWKEVPVVYAIITPKNSVNYIRVEKAFLDPVTSAVQIAQIADSLYYPANAIGVFLEEVGSSNKLALTRVDGNLEGIVREGGIFATQPNWLYKTTEPILAEKTYRLRIIRNDGQPDITAETTIPGDFLITTPSPSQSPVRIGFQREKATALSWRTDENGVYFNVKFHIRYSEYALNGAFIQRDTLLWTPIPNVRRTDIKVSDKYYKCDATVNTTSFFNFLVANLPVVQDRFRKFDGVDMYFEGGGKEIERYLETATANSGVTGAELVSSYTNLSEGFGIFTAKNTKILPNVQITAETITELNKQSPERDLNFQ